ncbi:MAG: glycerol-3-phosphate 1-O-acyltransferase PlsY [Betaproteobacteria bacterium]|nr:glycerol-3-phosphate 1-O-acyltransferase PlsY [Betaproteobacteria bacterium]
MLDWLAILLSYLLGSVSFAVVVSKLLGLPDPHSYGSKNPGATNVLRTGNKLAAVLTLFGDGLKGLIAVWLVARFSPQFGLAHWAAAAAALAVFLGHLYPVFHHFAGGKGVATAAGVMFALDWRLGAGVLLLWLLVALGLRISSLAAVVAALAAPPLGFWLFGARPESFVLLPLAALLIWRHRANLARLFAGQESKIGR